jgi:putative IMPACT (imprinted ancient) family translation regulator
MDDTGGWDVGGTTLKVRMKGNRWDGCVCLPELPTFLDQLEMYGSSDEEEHNNTDHDQDQDQDQDQDHGKYTKSEGCYHMEMVEKENVKEVVAVPTRTFSPQKGEEETG